VGHASAALKNSITLNLALTPSDNKAKAASAAAPADVALRFWVLVSAAEWYGPLTATLRVGGGGGAAAHANATLLLR
jgi:hypothetical protein